jgi:hypothetical protein
MTYINGPNKCRLLKLDGDRYAIETKHGNEAVMVRVDAETIRNMARHVEHEEKQNEIDK